MGSLHSVDDVTQATGCQRKNVEKMLEPMLCALREFGILSTMTAVGALATAAVESSFRLITEIGPESYFRRYDGRLGNDQPGDGYRYRGRGVIQLTGKSNYRHYGAALGLDLVAEPDRALEPGTASRVLACYFRERGVHTACNAGRWRDARRLVNGGTNGLSRFLHVVAALRALIS